MKRMLICMLLPGYLMLLTGCAMPRSVVSLNNLLINEGRRVKTRYNYMCTAGAHRGSSEEYRENTMAALKAAEDDPKFAFIEFDVQYSKDNKIVVYHDKRLFRQFGKMTTIGKTTFNDLQQITHGEITAYDEIIGLLSKRLNIEIKSQNDDDEDRRLVDAIMTDLQKRKQDENVLISSISDEVVKYVNSKYPETPTGQIFWLKSSTYFHIDSLTEGLYKDISESQADYLMMHVANLRNIDDLLRLKPKGKTVAFWDFDDTMYVVHKDLSDRLWGDSRLQTIYRLFRFKMASFWIRN